MNTCNCLPEPLYKLIGNTVLHIVSYSNNLSVLNIIAPRLESNNDHDDNDIYVRNARQSTALHIAAEQGHASVVDILLRNGAKLAVQDCFGDTTLHVAMRFNKAKVVKRIAEHLVIT